LLIRQTRLSRGVKGILVTSITVTTLVTSMATASAQNIFEALFGSLWSSPVTTYADPNAPLPSPEAARSEGGVAYCVRLCDGRYFPIQRHSGASSAQTCSSFCPASATNIYNGNSIAHAVAPDGKRYSELATTSAYREKIIPGCTCNGRDAFGLVNTAVADDPTLRAGDIVATNAGLMAYNGGTNGSTFTPISTLRDYRQTYGASSSKRRSRRPPRDLHPCRPSGRRRRRPPAARRISGLRPTDRLFRVSSRPFLKRGAEARP
jgi:Protein of unknown function (DUF2865)